MYQKPVQDIDDLKRRLTTAWLGIHQQVIEQAIDQWRERLRACVKQVEDILNTRSGRLLLCFAFISN